jgi:hypothetical protein
MRSTVRALLGAALRAVVALVQATADGGGGFSRV